jgi:hypothetical protein
MRTPTIKRRLSPFVLVVVAGLLMSIGTLVWIFATTPRPVAQTEVMTTATEPPAVAEPETPVPTPPAATLEGKWGIQVASLTLTNANAAVDLRYTVVAPEKTALLVDAQAEVYLIDQASGTKLPMMTAPPERTTPTAVPRRTIRRMMHQAGSFPPAPSRLIAGRAYSLQIPNWDGTIKSGSKVSFVIGDLRQDDLIVE